jgi:peptidoglycan/xylan/chitin deacetylase (PgdA/CDA1 family)
MLRRPAVPVLTYHSVHIDGHEYGSNDHIALASDLELIHAAGWTVIPATRAVRACLDRDPPPIPARSVVLTFDDGSCFDWMDLPHPSFGLQRGFAGILRDFRHRHGPEAQPQLHATSFVVVSPAAREVLDRTCLIGRRWWTDHWWPEAQQEGLIGIASHSWDHRHATLPDALRYNDGYGDFKSVSGNPECEFQVAQAARYLRQCLGTAPEPLFAYPYGDVPRYMVEHYFPEHGAARGIEAAFAADPALMTPDSERWRLPRFVFRRDWSDSEGLRRLLADCETRAAAHRGA